MTLWDWLTEVTVNKRNWSSFNDEDKKSWNSFMVNKFLSMNEDYLEFVNEFQKYSKLTPQQVYTVYKNIIPKQKVWLKFIKADTKEINKELSKLISIYFECGTEEAEVNLTLMSKLQIESILVDMGKDKKQIKKLLK